MKKKTLLFALLMPILSFSQSYVFCPEIEASTRPALPVDEISIVFKDSRTYEKKLKEKCSRNEIFTEFVSSLREAYPGLKINQLDDGNYNDTPKKGVLTVKVQFTKYDATFYPGIFIAKTSYSVHVLDYRGQSKTSEGQFIGEANQFNALGNTSAKKALNTSYQRAFDEFLVFLESEVTPQEKEPVKSVAKSKTERLRELKELLDEAVLTQEEFEKEKAKVLEE